MEPDMNNRTPIVCSFCPQQFVTMSNKYRHERTKHISAEEKVSHKCTYCELTVSNRFARIRHEKKVHGVDHSKTVKTDIRCHDCKISFRTLVKLRAHLSSVHEKDMSPVILQYNTFSDFLQWKEGEEYKKQVTYVLRETIKVGKTTYYCRRSGVRRPHRNVSSEGKKTRRSRGSCKLGMYCTSTIEVYRTENGFKVEYFPNHYGHQLSFLGLCQMRVPKDNEEQIESIQAKSDQTFMQNTEEPSIHIEVNSNILSEDLGNLTSNLYENIPEDVIEEIYKMGRDQRSSLRDEQDVPNIALDFGYDTLKALHKSDTISCQLIIESLGKEVLYSKQLGVVDRDHPEIMENEFVLIIMTTSQEKLFRECITRTRLLTLSMDSTYGIYTDYHATTLVNIDNENLGFPDAVCISSKVSEQILTLFFNKIKEKFGILYANIFMSDGIPIFRNAWKNVMGNSSINNSLICSFYVEKAWKKKIKAIPNADQESKLTIYSICRTLLEMKDELMFWDTARAFMINLELCGYVGFKKYFEISYLHENRVSMWATCFRLGIPVETNNHLEALQNILKFVFFDGRKGKRLDKCILGILKLIDSRVSNRKIDPIKKRTCGITLARSVKEIELGVFSVQSNNYDKNQCLVKRSINCSNCKERCILCNSCSHMYVCECENYKSNLCKHVNAVTMYLNAINKVSKKVETNKPNELENPDAVINITEEDIIIMEGDDIIMEEVSDSEDIGELKIQKINSILDIQDEITMQLSDKDFPYHIYSTIERQLKQIKETLDSSSTNTKYDNENKKSTIVKPIKQVEETFVCHQDEPPSITISCESKEILNKNPDRENFWLQL